MPGSPSLRFPGLVALLGLLASCSAGGGEATAGRPNVLWIVWDTVRADHLSLHGYARPTTRFLESWAKDARVFDDALSVAGYTLPSHASMFTGLLPSEHCTHHKHPWLGDSFTTVAELLRDAGYRTFLFSANPHVAPPPGGNLAQGFERSEHPWSPKWAPQAKRIVLSKLPPEDRSSELRQRLEASRGGRAGSSWALKASGEIAQQATLEWLAASDKERPWFVFLNYMEAHRPTTPARRIRERLLSPEDVEKSYAVDRSWLPMWEYTFGLRDYSDAEIELTRATYDATLIELDELLRGLLAELEQAGELNNTVVIVTSDHGEHLGEAHMLDHQYSLHQVLLHVPLVVHYPRRVETGREARPVSTLDLFPTVLELAGVPPPAGLRTQAVSLLAPQPQRRRFAESGSSSDVGVAQVKRAHPEFDPTPFLRSLRALVADARKFTWASDGRHALHDLATDPLETRDLLPAQPDLAARLAAELDGFWGSLERCDVAALPNRRGELSRAERRRLEVLGYAEEGGDAPDVP